MGSDLGRFKLLGPDIRLQTPSSFVSYVRSLKIERPIKVVRVKRGPNEPSKRGPSQKLTHEVVHATETNEPYCRFCKKKPRNALAKCSARSKKPVDESESSDVTSP